MLGVHFQKTLVPPRVMPGGSRSFLAMHATRLEGTKTFGRVQFGGALGYKTNRLSMRDVGVIPTYFINLGGPQL